MMKFNKVLLVDDDEISNFINTQVLMDINLADDIMVAMNGQEALELLRESYETDDTFGRPELIFLDLNMPIMDGFSFLQACEFCKNGNIKVVVLSSSTNSKDMEAAQRFPQVKYYLNKPLTADKVEQAIAAFSSN